MLAIMILTNSVSVLWWYGKRFWSKNVRSLGPRFLWRHHLLSGFIYKLYVLSTSSSKNDFSTPPPETLTLTLLHRFPLVYGKQPRRRNTAKALAHAHPGTQSTACSNSLPELQSTTNNDTTIKAISVFYCSTLPHHFEEEPSYQSATRFSLTLWLPARSIT